MKKPERPKSNESISKLDPKKISNGRLIPKPPPQPTKKPGKG